MIQSKQQARAARLKHEAENCLSLAVTTQEPAFAAELIDEALKLARRAHEIANGGTPSVQTS